jgi:hypothetical protein
MFNSNLYTKIARKKKKIKRSVQLSAYSDPLPLLASRSFVLQPIPSMSKHTKPYIPDPTSSNSSNSHPVSSLSTTK